MSFLDKLPVLLLQPIGAPPTRCKCGYPLEGDWAYCPSCGSWVDGEAEMYLCSLHPKAELSQETLPREGLGKFHCICLTCGATWVKPRSSVGEPPDYFNKGVLKDFQSAYFLRVFGVKL